ncbi:MAG: EAL domain-containing protein [Magnetovibrionaceae bacterium]
MDGNAKSATNHIIKGDNWAARLVGQSREMVALCDEQSILYINGAGASLIGYAQEDAKPLQAYVHPDYEEVVEALVAEPDDDIGWMPAKFGGKDGQPTLNVDLSITPMVIGGVTVALVQARDITKRMKAAETLRDREARLRGVMDTVSDAIITINENGEIAAVNRATETIFGYTQTEMVGQNVSMLMVSPIRDAHDTFMRQYRESGRKKVLDLRGREEQGLRKDGSVFPIEISIAELSLGGQRLFTGLVRDITKEVATRESLRKARDELELRVQERTRELTQEVTDRRRAEEELRLAGLVIDNLTEGVAITDPDFIVRSVNAAYSRITGYEADDVIGRKPPSDDILKGQPDLFDRMWADIHRTGRWEGEFWNARRNGDRYAERLSVSAITDECGEVTQYALVSGDITKRKEDEERIRYQANYDSLTGLPNRALFHDRLNQDLAHMARSKRNLALMFIDLDGFKLVNDTLGHDVGDDLLKEASRRLSDCVRNGDTVARLGGDEFTVIMPNLEDPRNAPIVAQRALDSLAKAFTLKGHEVFVSGSIGITIFPDDAETSSELIKNADAAMYRAKEQGKANYQFFTADMNAEVKERLVLKNNLNKALERDEFELYYQPKLNLETGRIQSAEALMRWQNDELGLVSPARFIPILEETGMVVEVGAWAIVTACQQHQAWRDLGLPPVRIAVNLSARQLREAGFVDRVKSILAETKTDPSGLEIEITESMLMSDAEKAVKTLGQLSDMGLKIAMDDFGTGYSSLSYLKKFPIDTIKIDRSFVSDIATNPDDAEIIRTIITMGRTLNRGIVAEGVETEDQLDILREYDCDEIQGYFFSPPLPSPKATRFLQEQFGVLGGEA